MTASAAIYFLASLGALKVLTADPDSYGDQIPVDYVANAMLALAALVWAADIAAYS